MVLAARLVICGFFAFGMVAQATSVTPMQKVITLLKDLSAKVAAEGKKEAAQYDKYACFCKEQADEKLYSIEKSDEKIAHLAAEIKELTTSIAALNSEVSDLSKKISNLEKEIDTKTKKRNKEHDEYLAKAKDMNEAIEACGAAIDALKNSKKSMKGAKLDFAQVEKVTGAIVRKVEPFLSSSLGVLSLMSELSEKAAPKFEYQSNDIIATLETLQATFKSMKKDLDFEEHDINSSFESTKLGLLNEKKFSEKEKTEKETLVAEQSESLETAKSNKDAEQSDRDADDTFMKDLTKECEEKAMLFDQRSKMRSEELSTLAEATEELQKGAVPNVSANKKLVGIAVRAVVKKAFVPPPAFVQISSVQQTEIENPLQGKAVQKALSFLHGAAGKIGSAALVNVEMRAKLAEDHFVKVRALIKDLISKLKADATAEADQKSICDKGMTKAVNDRDEANSQIEAANARITTLSASKKALEDAVATLQSDIAALQKALLEATELRNEDKAENTKTIAMSEEAVASVKLALNLLQDFYKKSALAQTGKYTPPKSDRDGNTVGDLAPEAFDSKYRGSQAESKGIVGILEVILADFERTNKKTTADEEESKEAFEKLEKESKDDIDAKQKDIKTKEGEIADTHSDLVDQEQALRDGKELLESALGSLESLQAMCVKGEETWEERKQKREDEIEALKNAMDILENWQGS